MTPSYEALRELVERVEAATWPSLELDGRIWCAVNGFEFVMWDGAGCAYRDALHDRRHAPHTVVRPYTASLDAITVLIERVNPLMLHGAQLAYMHDGIHGGHCWLYGPSSASASDIEFYGEGHAATLPLAMCSALLRAKLQEKEG